MVACGVGADRAGQVSGLLRGGGVQAQPARGAGRDPVQAEPGRECDRAGFRRTRGQARGGLRDGGPGTVEGAPGVPWGPAGPDCPGGNTKSNT
jgi:hypothetical protein